MPAEPDASSRTALSLRLSQSLHAHLSAGAARERRSLNQQIVMLLEEGSGFTKRKPQPKKPKGKKK